ncbi:MAG: hypothetical protein K9N10_07780 [Deltaproteobacteria bacterium]|nr:hypothetical protein [Deltaproteobacteria bacterium]
MKNLILLLIAAVGIWWGWGHFFNGSGTAPVIEGDGGHKGGWVISNGERVSLEEHLVPGKYTVFLFYADW